MSTSNFEYELFEHHIKISMNVYKYQELWVWFESSLGFEYWLLISGRYIASLTSGNIQNYAGLIVLWSPRWGKHFSRFCSETLYSAHNPYLHKRGHKTIAAIRSIECIIKIGSHTIIYVFHVFARNVLRGCSQKNWFSIFILSERARDLNNRLSSKRLHYQ